MELTKDLAYKALQKICGKKILLIVGTGASCALDSRFGMPALADELKKKIPKVKFDNPEAKEKWKVVEKNLDSGKDLESSLNGVNNKDLLNAIIRVTGIFVSKLDRENKIKIMTQGIEPPLEKLIKAIIDGLPESDPVIDIITPNYDLLIEHTCDKLKIPYCTGFVGGIQKHYDWNKAADEMIYIKTLIKSKKKSEVKRIKKHIRLHKVHGSVNWFRKDNIHFEDNSLLYENLADIERWIVTPGDTKYKEALIHNREIFAHADEIIPEVKSYIFVGYGFNDEQIESKITTELIENEKPGIIITKELSTNAGNYLKKSKNLWAIYQKRSNSCISNGQFEKPLFLTDSDIWKINSFTKHVLLGD